MIISIETATKSLDYDWYSESGSKGDARPRTVITENSASFAFYAERNNGGWSATILNLWIPEQKDQNGRRIRLSVRFDELESEAQARALALAYLALPLEKISSFRYARYSADLAACYGVAEDGTPLLLFDKMKQWAESAIARADLTKPCTPASSACFAEIDKSAITEIGELKRHLRTYALRDKYGMRILFDDGYVEGLETDVDIIITTCDTSSRIQYTPFKQEKAKDPASPKVTVKDGLAAARELAGDRLRQIRVIVDKAPEPTKKWCAGCLLVSIVALLILVIGLIPSPRSILVESTLKTLHLKIQGKEYTIGASREIKLKPTPSGIVELQITDIPPGSPVKLNGTEIGTGPGTYTIPDDGGSLQILPPKS